MYYIRPVSASRLSNVSLVTNFPSWYSPTVVTNFECRHFSIINFVGPTLDSMQTVLILFLTLALIYFWQKLFTYRAAIQTVQYVKNKRSHFSQKADPFVRNIPGYRVFLSPSSALGYILPRIPVICRGNNHFFEDKHARTLICTGERRHSWFRCRSLWICGLGCNFHSKASLTCCMCAT